jgi:hypothetical protein
MLRLAALGSPGRHYIFPRLDHDEKDCQERVKLLEPMATDSNCDSEKDEEKIRRYIH